MMPTYKTKQSGAFVAGVTNIKMPSNEIVINRNEANSGSVGSIITDGGSGNTWNELKNRSGNYSATGGINAGSESNLATTGSSYWSVLGMAFSEFNLSALSGIDPLDITSVILRYTTKSTGNLVNADRPKTFSAYSHSYSTLSSAIWKVVDTETVALGTAPVRDVYGVSTVDMTIPTSAVSGSILRIATMHDLLRQDSVSPALGGTFANLADGSPTLIVNGNFGSTFVPVNLGVL